jgi:hypothetical protein
MMPRNNIQLTTRPNRWQPRAELARQALTKALHARRDAGLDLTDAVAVYDVAERLGIDEVRFVDIPSLEELYWKDQQKIFVSSHRPAGRQAFNCAHGLGHHAFGHGFCIAAVNDGSRDTTEFEPDEFLADTFAGFFLMPKTVVCYGFSCRGWEVQSCTPLQAYIVAGWLGVGYATLIQHMAHSLHLITRLYANRLLRVTPSKIREHIVGHDPGRTVLIVDRHWSGRAVDTAIGDVLVIGTEFTTKGLQPMDKCPLGSTFTTTRPGSFGRIISESTGQCLAVRASRQNYVGRNVFRFEEDPDYDK